MNMKKALPLLAAAALLSGGCAIRGTFDQQGFLYDKLHDTGLYRAVKTEQEKKSYSALPKISAHEHYRKGADMELYLKVAAELGIRKAVFFPTGSGPDNHGYPKHLAELLEVQKKYPDQVVAFATVDEADPQAAEVVEKAIQDGARGLKLIGGHPNFYDEPLDSPNMYRVYNVMKKYRLPIVMHVSLTKFPKQKKELEKILVDFPDITVVAAHYAKTAPHLEDAQDLLDRYANLYVDISMGGGLHRYQKEIGMESKKFRDFIIRNQDRILWGTDIILSRSTEEEFLRRRITTDFHIFEQRFYVDDRFAPGQIHAGFALPPEVLKKIYYDNPKRILNV